MDCLSGNQPTKRPVAFYPKGVALLDILRLEVKASRPLRMKDLKENASKLYENAKYSRMEYANLSYMSKRKLC